jgi:hypothetical protein
MPKFNQYLIENKKSIELVQELEKYEIKKSPLSLSARGKVINKSGSGYVSENKNDYGPCKNSICNCSCLSNDCNCGGGVKSVLNINDGFRIASVSASGRVKEGSVG